MDHRDGNSVLMQGGTASAKFPALGATVTGRILRKPDASQQTDMATGAPLTFPNGDPRMQAVVALATNERDPSIVDDNGERALYIKGNMLAAVRDAVRRAGADGLDVGGILTVQYVGDGEVKTRGFDPPKLYAAAYQPPASNGNATLMGNGVPAAQVAPTPTYPPMPTYAPAPQPAYAAPPQQLAPVPAPTPAPAYAAPAPQLAYAAPPLPVAVPAPAAALTHPSPTLASAGAPAPSGVGVMPAPAAVDPNVWARMDDGQRQSVLVAIGATPPF